MVQLLAWFTLRHKHKQKHKHKHNESSPLLNINLLEVET